MFKHHHSWWNINMALRPKHIYSRLNRARLDSNALHIHIQEIIQLYREVREAHASWEKGDSPAKLARTSQQFTDNLSKIFLVPQKALSLLDRSRHQSHYDKA